MSKIRKVILFLISTVVLISMDSHTLPAQSIAGNAIYFNNEDYLACPLALDTTRNLTIDAWIFPQAFPQFAYPVYVGKDTTEGFGFVIQTNLVTNEGYISIMCGGVKMSVTGNGARLPLEQWCHIAMTRGDSIWNLYKNGALIGRGKTNPLKPTTQITFGKSFVGKMDNIRIWNRELSYEEIGRTMSTQLSGSENGLIIFYSADQDSNSSSIILLNKGSTSSGFNATSGNKGIKLTKSTAQFIQSPTPRCTFLNYPQHMQFYARDKNSNSPLVFEGSINESGFDSVILERFDEDHFVKRIAEKLVYQSSNAPFHTFDTIHAGRVRSTYRMSVRKKDVVIFVKEAADIVSGDVFLINGQSNAHPTVEGYFWQNPFARSFGIQTPTTNLDPYDPADTLWGLSTASGWGEDWSGAYLSGAWGQGMQERIIGNYGIPVCIINGGAGGSIIELHLRNDANKFDLSSIYGRLYYRTIKSGLINNIKAFFWYQGEYNYFNGYFNNFKQLYNAWGEDYHDLLKSPKFYVMQIRPGCFAGDSRLREIQRTLPDSFPNISAMSSNAIPGHFECHFYWYGYVDIAEDFFRLVSHDFYGSVDTTDIYPPNIKDAKYGNSNQDIIVLKFPNSKKLALTPDTLISGKLRQLKDYFYLDSISGKVNNVIVQGDSVILQLSLPSNAKGITYLPDRTYEGDDTLIYEGPWIMNERGIGAFSFNNFPISPYVPDTTTSDTGQKPIQEFSMQCFPNPITKTMTILYSLTQAKEVQFDVLDILGKTALSLGKRDAGAGANIATYDLSMLAIGEYILRMTIGAQIYTQKIIVMK